MKGLAWFARQVPSEGFSDVHEGRVGEKEIPHSDQWVQPPAQAGNYHPENFNRKQVIKGKNRGGVTNMLIEEIYQSDECNVNKTPHNATYENGRFVYAYPPAFQNSRSVNKMIAVRRIETKNERFLINFRFDIDTSEESSEREAVLLQVPTDYTIEQILKEIKNQFEEKFMQLFELELVYRPSTHQVVMRVTGCMKWSITRLNDNDDFLKLMNVTDFNSVYGQKLVNGEGWVFKDVRSRDDQDVFIHASFVTNTTSGYLGRGGEFYTTPSKIYPDDGQNFFTLEVSLDGYHKVQMPYENFIVELTFIIDSENYMGS
jgi:hypothetical protein